MAHDELPENLRPRPAAEGRPPDATESGSRHHFTVSGDEYSCTRCGRKMTPEALEETCPSARPGGEAER